MKKFCDDHEWVGKQGEMCPECDAMDAGLFEVMAQKPVPPAGEDVRVSGDSLKEAAEILDSINKRRVERADRLGLIEDVRAVVDEPVAYMRQDDSSYNNLIKCTFTCPGAFGVYRHPPKKVGN